LEALNDSWYLRKFAREAIERSPSIEKMALSIVGRRRRGSPATVNSYIPGILKYVDFIGYDNPEEALQAIIGEEVDVEDSLNGQGSGFIDMMLERYANKTVNTYIHGVKKWLEVNDVKVDWDKVEMPTTSVTRNVDRAPTEDELRLILNHAFGLVDRLGITMLISSGLRIGTLLSLRWGDVDFGYPDVARITVRRAPGRKFSSRSARGGESNLYITWITPEAKEMLIEWKRYRESNGEAIMSDSYLFPGRRGHLTVSSFERRWYRILRKVGLDHRSHNQYELRLHTLRKYFRSHCIGVDSSYREHWMGHKGGYLDESYFRAEEQRHLQEYRKVIPHLSLYPTEQNELEIRKKALLDFVKFQGWKKEKIRQFEEILQRARTVDEAAEEFSKLREEPKDNGGYKVAESEDKMLDLLNDGWELVRELNSEKFLMRRI